MKLQITANGKGFLQNKKPFFWLADTAWLLIEQLTPPEIALYLENRKTQGYNVILFDLAHRAQPVTPEGHAAFGAEPFKDFCKDAPYWQRVHAVVKSMEQKGLVAGVLPVWSSSFQTSAYLCKETMLPYVTFVADLLADCTNVVWILGGDIRAEGKEDLFHCLGRLLKEKQPERLVGFHPFGRTTSSRWFHTQPWLDFNLYQSGHRRYDQTALQAWDDAQKDPLYGEDCYRYAQEDLAKTPSKPTLDGEPSYEEIVQGLHDPHQPYWTAEDVRRYAYWNVFSGAAGHTYGHNSVMQFYSASGRAGAFGVKTLWQEALHHPGSQQMRHLKYLGELFDFTQATPQPQRLCVPQATGYAYLPILAAQHWLMAYTYEGRPFSVQLTGLKTQGCAAYWYSPVTGTLSCFCCNLQTPTLTAVPPQTPLHHDWVLLICHPDDLPLHPETR